MNRVMRGREGHKKKEKKREINQGIRGIGKKVGYKKRL